MSRTSLPGVVGIHSDVFPKVVGHGVWEELPVRLVLDTSKTPDRTWGTCSLRFRFPSVVGVFEDY